eukprot:9034234-Pyramimonas_sp.AAC.1
MDTVTYFCYSPQTVHEYGWGKTPAGVMSFISLPTASNRNSVVGCIALRRGLAEGCAAVIQNPYLYKGFGSPALRRGSRTGLYRDRRCTQPERGRK